MSALIVKVAERWNSSLELIILMKSLTIIRRRNQSESHLQLYVHNFVDLLIRLIFSGHQCRRRLQSAKFNLSGVSVPIILENWNSTSQLNSLFNGFQIVVGIIRIVMLSTTLLPLTFTVISNHLETYIPSPFFWYLIIVISIYPTIQRHMMFYFFYGLGRFHLYFFFYVSFRSRVARMWLDENISISYAY